jgi:hypothetical protein
VLHTHNEEIAGSDSSSVGNSCSSVFARLRNLTENGSRSRTAGTWFFKFKLINQTRVICVVKMTSTSVLEGKIPNELDIYELRARYPEAQRREQSH